jgi:hypothetical protein
MDDFAKLALLGAAATPPAIKSSFSANPGRALEPAHLLRNTNRTFERPTVPAASLSCGGIGGGEKVEQQTVRFRGLTDPIVWQNKLP